MGKQEFLDQLRKQLSGLPQADIEERLNFYSEMIDDRMEEGLSEEEAVLAVGPIEAPVLPNKTGRRLKTREIVLLAVSSPIWLALLIVAAAVYASAWVVVAALWAAFGALIGCGVGGFVGGTIMACTGNALPGIATVGAGITCAGLAIFAFFGCTAATSGMVKLTKLVCKLGKKEAA